MRTFMLRARKGPTSERFHVLRRCGPHHLDVLCSTIVNAISLSLRLRTDTIIHVVCEGAPQQPVCITFDTRYVQHIIPDEEGVAKELQYALQKNKHLSLGTLIDIKPGITLHKISFERLVEQYQNNAYYLHPQGQDIRDIPTDDMQDGVFILGDYIGLPKKTEQLLDRRGVKRLTVGPHMLYANHCVVLVHNELDRREVN
ncbi:MAG: hypothetical protein ACMXYC_03275 [Candidatus Woesearchaeota archaeon]